ncbi:TPA: sporulation-delaying protein SdpB family protein [Staphylococcus aureus]
MYFLKKIAGLNNYPVCDTGTKYTAFCITSNSHIYLVITKYIIILILLIIILGYLPQILGILHFYISYSIQNTMTTIDGGEQVTLVITFWLMLISLFDNRINHWHMPNEKFKYNKVIGWALIIALKIQIAYIYLNSAITKMKNREWLDGSAVYYYLNDNLYGIPKSIYNLFSFVLETPLVGLITWGTLIVQLLIFASIFAGQKTKKIMFWIATLMHESFALFMGLISFSLIMFAVLYFYFHPIRKINGGHLNEKTNLKHNDRYFNNGNTNSRYTS